MTIEKKYAYIETFGCQMNERDSEIMGQLVAGDDYVRTMELNAADLVIINTCSIRDKAEQKVYSLLGRLKILKKSKPAMIITVAGCVAQQEGRNLTSRMPQIDIVVGTQNIYRLPELVRRVETERQPQVAVDLSPAFTIPNFSPGPCPAPDRIFKKFVTIMQGCNNFCAYCVVPHTRGRETSRAQADILAEIETLAQNGVKEITLLGQNVNSYGQDKGGSHDDFPELLQNVAAIKEIERVRFTTSHPKDLSEKLIRCFGEIDKLCPHFHLPVQSGSDRILKLMNRKYTIASYLEKVANLRAVRPDIALTTDIIVGFPGETEVDFEETMQLLEMVRYYGAFSFKYSDRPMTRSVDFPDKVSEADKSRRLARLQVRQNEITLERNREYEGSIMEVMVEGKSKKDGQWSGRTTTNHIVNFTTAGELAQGRMVEVKIVDGCQNSLRGTLI